MKVELIPLEQLMPDPVNARKGNVQAVVESLREFGQHRPIVVQRDSNRIIAGNHLFKAAKILGWTEIAAYFVDDDDLKALRRSLADNRTNDIAEWDEETLAELVKAAGDDIPGFDDDFLDRLLKEEAEDAKLDQPVYPIVARFNESYDYVVILSTNETDYAFLETVLELRQEKSYKNSSTGKSRVLTAERFAELWKSRS